MGIRFLCPNGHKLNVKSFLAGKRAICPKCGVRVTVPDESTRPESSSSTKLGAPGGEGLHEDESLDESILAEARSTIAAAAAQSTAQYVTPRSADPLAEAPEAVWYVRPVSGGQYGPASAEIMRAWIKDGRVAANSLIWRDGWPQWRSAGAVFPELGDQLLTAPPAPTVGEIPLPNAAAAAGASGLHVALPSPPNEDPAAESSGAMSFADAARRRRRKNDVSLMASAVLVVISLILIIVLLLVFRAKHDQRGRNGPASRRRAGGSRLTAISVCG